MPSLVCVPIMVEDAASALADAEHARALGADLVEFRIDQAFSGEGDAEGARLAERLAGESPLPCIVTCRPAYEGGYYDGDDAARVSLFERLGALDRPPRYLDAEHVAYTRSANIKQKINLAVEHPGQVRDLHTSLILSHHDFGGRPANLMQTVAAMASEPAAAVLKVAYRARSLRDNLELLELQRERPGGKPMIALGMGEFGLMSRVLAPKFGGFLTFASLRDSSATAPGQPTVAELLARYRFRSISHRTRVFGVVGWPVGHSLSPLVHNAAFEAMGFDGVYLPLPIPPEWEHFKATMLALLDEPHLTFRGCSVTIPHKEHLLRLAREDRSRAWVVDELADRIGAANTLSVGDDGICRVLNTDAAGVVGPLEAALGDLRSVNIAVLGAGGAARAAAFGLAERGANVLLYNRTRDRAEALRDELAQRLSPGAGKIVVGASEAGGGFGRVCESCCGAIVNCTPIGMAGGPSAGASPIDAESLKKVDSSAVVMDTVYRPLETPLLAAARAAGLRSIDGLAMFVAQAVRQSEIFTGGMVEGGRQNAYSGPSGAGSDALTRLFGRICQEAVDSTSDR
ncbi:MAG: type I 3-dehydroquinate dehydratase [Phycisphaerales bacterium]|nr:type I 3-dehydroquinate dehydratase [Phycisphaerales bacterium]